MEMNNTLQCANGAHTLEPSSYYKLSLVRYSIRSLQKVGPFFFSIYSRQHYVHF